VTNPIWVIKTRLCLQYTGSPAAVTQAPQYKGMIGKKEGNLANLTFAKTSGTVARDWEKIGQQLTGTSSVTIPETIAGRMSVPGLWSFLKL